MAGCDESVEAILRKRRLCFAGFVASMGDDRLPIIVLLEVWARLQGTREDKILTGRGDLRRKLKRSRHRHQEEGMDRER